MNIWRRKLDSWLAGQSGAEVRQQTLVRSVTQRDGVRISALGRGAAAGPREYACKYLVGADGWSSTVRGCIDPQWRDKPADIVVYQEYCRDCGIGSLRPGHWHVFFRPEVGDILCCAHTKDDFLTLCVGAARGKDNRLGMRRFKEFLATQFGVSTGAVERAEGCTIKQLPHNLGAGRVLLTGEAAGMAYLNGEGISVALDSGYRAGLAIAEALSRGGDALELYRSRSADILQHMGLCFRNMRFLVGQ